MPAGSDSSSTGKTSPAFSKDGEILTYNTDDFIIGDRVWVNGIRPGYIQYIGETKFASGDWAGVVLDDPVGKNDGCVAGVRYFQCEPKRGVFARLHRLTRYPLPGRPGSLSPPPQPRRCLSPASPPTIKMSPSPTPSPKSSPTKSPVTPRSGGILTTTTTTTTYGPRLKIGDRVIVNSSQGSKNGYLRYLGRTEFAAGEWAGVELDEPVGKNDGSVAGKRYFTCPMKYGLFAPTHKVVRVGGPHITTKVVRTTSPLPPSGERSPLTERKDGRTDISQMTSSLRVLKV